MTGCETVGKAEKHKFSKVLCGFSGHILCWNISVLVIMVTVWSFEFQSYAGLQICGSAIVYYISNPTL
jgi:hypothetical protein